MPFLYWYLPLPYFLSYILFIFFKFSIEFILNLLSLISLIFSTIFIYFVVFHITRNRYTSLLSSLLFLSSPIVFVSWYIEGVYAMTISIFFVPLSIFLLLSFLKKPNKINFILCIIAYTLTYLSHFIVVIIVTLMNLLIFIFYPKDFHFKTINFFKIYILTFLLTSFFYLPFIFIKPETQEVITCYKKDIFTYILSRDRNIFIPRFRVIDPYLSPFIFTLLIYSLFIFMFERKGKNIRDYKRKRFLLIFSLSSLMLLIYTIIPLKIHLNGFEPSNSLLFLNIFLAIFIGISINMKSKMYKVLIIIIVISLILIYPINTKFTCKKSVIQNYFVIEEVLKFENLTHYSYRFGIPVNDRGISQWFNYKFNIPQTRHWFIQGILNKKWLDWMFYIIWETDNCYNETYFAFDWYAIKWFITIDDQNKPFNISKKFLTNDDFIFVGKDKGIYSFVYENASELIVPSNSTTVLIIGEFNNIYHTLSMLNYNSKKLIPIIGKEYIDDYKYSEISNFDLIILYGYKYRNKDKAFELIKRYVEEGGKLIIETGFSPDSTSNYMPLPCPIRSTFSTDYGFKWDLTYIKHPITKNINFSRFAPPIYDEYPWGVSSTLNESICDWAKPIVWINKNPIIVLGRYGKGVVIWSGFNLPYHIVYYYSYTEASLFINLIKYLTNCTFHDKDIKYYSYNRLNPENIEIDIYKKYRGVIIKENYFYNWKAFIKLSNDKCIPLNIYKVGPGFMYIRLPDDIKYPIKLQVIYQPNLFEIIGILISSLTLIFLIIYYTWIPFYLKLKR